MVHAIKQLIHQLEEEEVRALLLQQFVQLQLVAEDNGYTAEQFYLQTQRTYDALVASQQQQARTAQTEAHFTHIVFSGAAGSLKIALREAGNYEQIIVLSDAWSAGPLRHLDSRSGIAERYAWLASHFSMDDDEHFTYTEKIHDTVNKIRNIPLNHYIIIWAGNNGHEQTDFRFVLSLLHDKKNELRVMNINEAYEAVYENTAFTPRHMGELSAVQLARMYTGVESAYLLSQAERHQLIEQWQTLSEAPHTLRIWQNGTIATIPESYYDAYILEVIQESLAENRYATSIKVARVIGEVIGHLEELIGDQFIYARIIRLVIDGALQMEGIPTAMRYDHIQLRCKEERTTYEL